jgi:hypothetical protein
MPFFPVPIFFAEDDFETKESCGLPVEHTVDEIFLNTNHIVAFNHMDNGHTLIRMVTGESYECLLGIDVFEDQVSAVEHVVRLTDIGTN